MWLCSHVQLFPPAPVDDELPWSISTLSHTGNPPCVGLGRTLPYRPPRHAGLVRTLLPPRCRVGLGPTRLPPHQVGLGCAHPRRHRVGLGCTRPHSPPLCWVE